MSTIDPSYVVAIVMTALGCVAWLMVVGWKKNFESRLMAQDRRLEKHSDKHSKHENNHATLVERLNHLSDTTEETRLDVKELLRQSNGKRSSG